MRVGSVASGKLTGVAAVLSFAKRGSTAPPAPPAAGTESPAEEMAEGTEPAPMIAGDAELCCPHCGEYFPAAEGVMPQKPMASAPAEVEDESDGQLGYTFRGARS